MRRSLLTAAALAATLTLAACGDGGVPAETPSPTPSPSETSAAGINAPPTPEDITALDAVTVEGELGATPTLTFDTPFAVSTAVARVDVAGTGEALEAGQILKLHFVFVDGATGEPLQSTYDVGIPQSFQLGDPSMPNAMNAVLADQKVGVRFLLAVPGAPAEDGTTGASTIFAFEVIEARPGHAVGTAVEPPAGLPQVTVADDHSPSVTVPGDATEPTELVAQTLIEGEGDPLEAGDIVLMHYTGWLWDGTQFDSSWGGTPFLTAIGTGQVIQGWDQGLVGKTVGSQVLLVIPAELGYGEQGSGGRVPPNATLIFVVDILDSAGTL